MRRGAWGTAAELCRGRTFREQLLGLQAGEGTRTQRDLMAPEPRGCRDLSREGPPQGLCPWRRDSQSRRAWGPRPGAWEAQSVYTPRSWCANTSAALVHASARGHSGGLWARRLGGPGGTLLRHFRAGTETGSARRPRGPNPEANGQAARRHHSSGQWPAGRARTLALGRQGTSRRVLADSSHPSCPASPGTELCSAGACMAQVPGHVLSWHQQGPQGLLSAFFSISVLVRNPKYCRKVKEKKSKITVKTDPCKAVPIAHLMLISLSLGEPSLPNCGCWVLPQHGGLHLGATPGVS